MFSPFSLPTKVQEVHSQRYPPTKPELTDDVWRPASKATKTKGFQASHIYTPREKKCKCYSSYYYSETISLLQLYIVNGMYIPLFKAALLTSEKAHIRSARLVFSQGPFVQCLSHKTLSLIFKHQPFSLYFVSVFLVSFKFQSNYIEVPMLLPNFSISVIFNAAYYHCLFTKDILWLAQLHISVFQSNAISISVHF